MENADDTEPRLRSSTAVSHFLPRPILCQLKPGMVCRWSEEGRSIVYTDETYITQWQYRTYNNWRDGRASGLLSPASRAKGLVLCLVEGRTGCIPNTQLIFKSNQKTRDYHNEMNSENFIRRLNENLITNLGPNSVLVMDNASYQNTQGQSPKVQFKLGNCRIGYVVGTLLFCSTMLEVQLYGIMEVYKTKQKRDCTLRGFYAA